MANPNTAVFPGRAATDSDLFVASDKVATTLTAPVGGGDTTINVVSTTGIFFPTIINIDNEQIACASATSTVITVASSGRGFNGTTATSHLSGAAVNCFVDSYYNNQLAAEVKAIENVLANPPVVTPFTYDFAAQTPGGTLTASVGASVTLSPVPVGVNASDSNHYLYISGGTGTAEAVLITGGTAVSGGASGTVQFTPANNHSGAWTIKSASGGIAENIQDNSGALASLAAGNFNIYGPVTLPFFTTLMGKGSFSTILTRKYAGSGFMLTVNGGANLADLGFATGAGLLLTVTGGFVFMTGSDGYLRNLRNIDTDPTNCSSNFITFNAAARIYVDTIFLGEGFGKQIYFTNSSGGNLNNITGGGTSTNQTGVHWESGSLNGSNWNLQLTGSNSSGLLITPGAAHLASEAVIDNVTLDSCGAVGVQAYALAGATVGGITLSNFRISVVGCPVATAGCVDMTFSNFDIAVVSSAVSASQFRVISGININLNNVKIINGGGVTGYNGIVTSEAGAAVVGLVISDSIIGQLLSGGPDTAGCNNGLYLNTAASDYITVTGNIIGGTVPFTDTTTGIHKVIRDNVGIDDVIPAIASAASITLPVNPIFTVTGTTGVGTVVSTQPKGARGVFITTSGVVVFTAGATIGNTVTTVQNVPVSWYWDGTKIWLK